MKTRKRKGQQFQKLLHHGSMSGKVLIGAVQRGSGKSTENIKQNLKKKISVVATFALEDSALNIHEDFVRINQ